MTDTPNGINIAIVEDDTVLREELNHFLTSHGHVVNEVISGTALDDLFQETTVDIVILDLNLPGQSGFEIAKRYRQAYPELGIIILSARTAAVDRVGSYEQGADIYIPKPCPPDELLAAVNSLSRRIKPQQSSDRWQLDSVRQMLTSPTGTHVQLLAVEALIIERLARAAKYQISAEDLCVLIAENGLHGESSQALTKRALENKISRLRKKFAKEVKNQAILIRSVRSEGYQLCIPVHVLPVEFRNDSPDQ
jgi:two-component system OmpR family response regulator